MIKNRGPGKIPQGLPGQKVIVYELLQDVFLQTDGTTAVSYTDLDCSEWEHLGPYVESLYVLTSTVNRTSDHQWAISTSWTNSGRAWSTPMIVAGLITANGDAPLAPASLIPSFTIGRLSS